MHYTSQYPSPLGELLLAADDDGLTGVWFVGQKYFARSLAPDSVAREIPLFAQVKQWLALYFAGQEPELEIPIHMVGTAFQKAVWRILRTIPYGQTIKCPSHLDHLHILHRHLLRGLMFLLMVCCTEFISTSPL